MRDRLAQLFMVFGFAVLIGAVVAPFFTPRARAQEALPDPQMHKENCGPPPSPGAPYSTKLVGWAKPTITTNAQIAGDQYVALGGAVGPTGSCAYHLTAGPGKSVKIKAKQIKTTQKYETDYGWGKNCSKVATGTEPDGPPKKTTYSASITSTKWSAASGTFVGGVYHAPESGTSDTIYYTITATGHAGTTTKTLSYGITLVHAKVKTTSGPSPKVVAANNKQQCTITLQATSNGPTPITWAWSVSKVKQSLDDSTWIDSSIGSSFKITQPSKGASTATLAGTFTRGRYWKLTVTATGTFTGPNGCTGTCHAKTTVTMTSDHVTISAATAMVKGKDGKMTPRQPELGQGVLCINASNTKPSYDWARFTANVTPYGITAKIKVIPGEQGKPKADVSVTPSSVTGGSKDTKIKVTGGSKPGYYKLQIYGPKGSDASMTSAKGTAFKFVSAIKASEKPGVHPPPNPGLGSQGKSPGEWGTTMMNPIPANYDAYGLYWDTHSDDKYAFGDPDPDFIGESIIEAEIDPGVDDTNSASDEIGDIGIATKPQNAYDGSIKASFDATYKGTFQGSGQAYSGGSLSVGISFGILSLAGSVAVDDDAVTYGAVVIKVGDNKHDAEKVSRSVATWDDTFYQTGSINKTAGVGSQDVKLVLTNGVALMALRYDAGAQAKATPNLLTAGGGDFVRASMDSGNVTITNSYWKIVP